MANFVNNSAAVGFQNAIQGITPPAIVSARAPTVADLANYGQVWIWRQPPPANINTGYVYIGSIQGQGQWSQLAYAPGDTFPQLTVNPGPTTLVGTVNVTTGPFNVLGGDTSINAVGGGNVVIGDLGNVSIGSAFSTPLAGLNSAGTTSIISTGVAANAVNINANLGGASISAGVAGITLAATNGQVSISSTQAVPTAVSISAPTAGGGLTLSSATGGIGAITSGQLVLESSAAGVTAIEIAGLGVTSGITLGTGATGGTVIGSGTAGSTYQSTGQIIVTSSQANANAILIQANNAIGGIVLDSLGGTFSSTDGINQMTSALGAAANAIAISAQGVGGGISETAHGGGITLHDDIAGNIALTADGGNITATATAGTMSFTSQGTATIESVIGNAILEAPLGQVRLTAGEVAAANAVLIQATDAAGGITMQSGTAGLIIQSGGQTTMAFTVDNVAAGFTGAVATTVGRVVYAALAANPIAAGATQLLTIQNAAITVNSMIMVSMQSSSAADQIAIVNQHNTNGVSFEVLIQNVAAVAATTGNVAINFWIMGY